MTGSLPQVLTVAFDGERNGIKLYGELPNAIVDGKLDRDGIYRAGRLPEKVDRFSIVADGVQVAAITRTETTWTVYQLGEEGEEIGRETFDRDNTLRPKRKGSKAPSVIDTGPDLFMAVNRTVKRLWPDLKSTGRNTKTDGADMRKKLDIAREENTLILQAFAKIRGISVEDAARDLGVTVGGK